MATAEATIKIQLAQETIDVIVAGVLDGMRASGAFENIKDWMTAEEIQSYFDISESTLRGWIKDGLQIHRRGAKRYFEFNQVREFIDRG